MFKAICEIIDRKSEFNNYCGGLKFFTFIKCPFEQLPSLIINTNNFKLVILKVIRYLYFH